MKKVLLSLLTITLAFITMQPSQAEDQRVLAIVDTAINSNNFSQIIHEVCFTTVKSKTISQDMSCPNRELFMEGKGAASAPWPLSINNTTYHGDSMVKSALKVSPDIKIVFIRIANVTSLGNSSVPPNGETILGALNWIATNGSKYSIDAVSISQSGVKKDLSGNVIGPHIGCSDPSILNPFTLKVSELNKLNVPTFVATGNDKQTFVGFPACVPGVIGVGALGSATQLEAATNTGPGLDMVAPGKLSITKYNGSLYDTAGTSVATAVSSSSYVKRNTFNIFSEYLSSLPKILINSVTYMLN